MYQNKTYEMNSRKLKSRSGFTLIEAIVSVAIGAVVLVGVLDNLTQMSSLLITAKQSADRDEAFFKAERLLNIAMSNAMDVQVVSPNTAGIPANRGYIYDPFFPNPPSALAAPVSDGAIIKLAEFYREAGRSNSATGGSLYLKTALYFQKPTPKTSGRLLVFLAPNNTLPIVVPGSATLPYPANQFDNTVFVDNIVDMKISITTDNVYPPLTAALTPVVPLLGTSGYRVMSVVFALTVRKGLHGNNFSWCMPNDTSTDCAGANSNSVDVTKTFEIKLRNNQIAESIANQNHLSTNLGLIHMFQPTLPRDN